MEKKLVGIYTIQAENYGNRLQNYAVQFVLRQNNCITKSFYTYDLDKLSKKYKVNKKIYLLLKKIQEIIEINFRYNRSSNFKRFNKKIAYSKEWIGKQTISTNIHTDYDAIIVGSDQVWNMTFDWLSDNAFIPFPHPKKISFSASFGVDSIPYNQKIVECLKDFKALSVREKAGAEIIKKLTGRDAEILVDPTMLLTKEEWRSVSKKPKGAKEDGYIVTYFLSPKCDAARERLEELRKGKNVYELLNPNDKVANSAGPSEFLWLFDHADLILTDSFHACVFSFLFNKPFIVYDRNWNEGNMNSRLETLLSKFHLERKYANSGLENGLWEHDYTESYRQLELEKEKAINFLKKALE